MKIEIATRRLELEFPWRISRGTADFKEYHFISISQDGVTGLGEAAHNSRYDESLESIGKFLHAAEDVLHRTNLWEYHDALQRINRLCNGQNAAKAAIDMAIMDWITKQLDIPLYKFLGVNKSRTPVTSYSLGIDTPENLQQRIKNLREFPVLKIKLGGEQDEEILRAVREVTNATIRVDANEGWKDRHEALERIGWLLELGVEFVEQPLPAGRLDDVAWLRERSPLPLVADEDVKSTREIPALAGVYDGINIKLMKAGGIQEALRMIYLARALGLKIMLGCMVESSLGVTAAAHLSPLADWSDLDGNLLLKNDPYRGVTVRDGLLVLPEGPGLGVVPADFHAMHNQSSP